jgi:flavin-binding protein dodecin
MQCSPVYKQAGILADGGAISSVGSGTGETPMDDHVYRIIEVAGSSEKSIEDAIRTAVARASATLKHLRWFEVVETRGHIDNGEVHHFQVTLKLGFTLEGE